MFPLCIMDGARGGPDWATLLPSFRQNLPAFSAVFAPASLRGDYDFLSFKLLLWCKLYKVKCPDLKCTAQWILTKGTYPWDYYRNQATKTFWSSQRFPYVGNRTCSAIGQCLLGPTHKQQSITELPAGTCPAQLLVRPAMGPTYW